MQATVPFALKRERHHYRQAERATARVILQNILRRGGENNPHPAADNYHCDIAALFLRNNGGDKNGVILILIKPL